MSPPPCLGISRLRDMLLVPKASCEWVNLWDALAPFDMELRHSMSFYLIQMHSRPVPEFRPDLVLVAPLYDTDEVHLWPVPSPARAKGRGGGGRPRARPPQGRGQGKGGHADEDRLVPSAMVGDVDEHGPPVEGGLDEALGGNLTDLEPDEAEVDLEQPADDADESLFADLDAAMDRILRCSTHRDFGLSSRAARPSHRTNSPGI